MTAITAELTAELAAELDMRNKQYQYYRDKLLSENELAKVGFEWKTLKEISLDFGRGKSKFRPRNDERLYGGDIPFIQTGDIRGSAKKIKNYNQTYSDFGLAQSKLWKKNTLCITIAANIAETAILDFDACFPDSIIGFIADPKQVDVNYIYYLLQSLKIKLQSYSTGSAQENINLATFEDLLFPIPPLAEQARIVAILDKFDTLTQSISDGLPREIDLRQKQYEYYREALLSFWCGDMAKYHQNYATIATFHQLGKPNLCQLLTNTNKPYCATMPNRSPIMNPRWHKPPKPSPTG